MSAQFTLSSMGG
ncbi:hypothetical protein AZE42_13806 [Rhizopogon vesiculosus]|uniref:Uncharacterized protein n=1 Tax=Rhizopogon vesiculosus TaxID=180088 RepID=A0A1J8Q5C5_9AGAM|nr:hypothetical protein AZE42_13806 [Rhizopogon vesiculosus]